MNNIIWLDGENLTISQLMSLNDFSVKIDLKKEAWEKVKQGRNVIEEIINSNKKVYGINTGFGHFSNVTINKENIDLLQLNLIRSHASGVGSPISIGNKEYCF